MPFKKKTSRLMGRREPRGRTTKAAAKNTTESGLCLRLDELIQAVVKSTNTATDSWNFRPFLIDKPCGAPELPGEARSVEGPEW